MKTNAKINSGVKVTANVKAGSFNGNHNRRIATLTVKSGIKAGSFNGNHNRRIATLTVKSGIKAGEGILLGNHSRRLA